MRKKKGGLSKLTLKVSETKKNEDGGPMQVWYNQMDKILKTLAENKREFDKL